MIILNNEVQHRKVNDLDLNIYTYRKEGSSISIEDYLQILREHLQRENMAFDYLYYEYENENGHQSGDIVYDINQLSQGFGEFLYSVDAFYHDENDCYRLSFSPAFGETIKLTTSKIMEHEHEHQKK